MIKKVRNIFARTLQAHFKLLKTLWAVILPCLIAVSSLPKWLGKIFLGFKKLFQTEGIVSLVAVKMSYLGLNYAGLGFEGVAPLFVHVLYSIQRFLEGRTLILRSEARICGFYFAIKSAMKALDFWYYSDSFLEILYQLIIEPFHFCEIFPKEIV